MQIGFLHLSDIHIQSSSDWIIGQSSQLKSALNTTFENCNRIYIIVSGDIVYSGKGEEYAIAKSFLSGIRDWLNRVYGKDTLFQQIIVSPGNHDCNFSQDNQVRRNIVKQMSAEIIGDDNSVIDLCVHIQKDFFKFESELNSRTNELAPSLSYSYQDQLEHQTIQFCCFNTAWMSSIKENLGSLYFPTHLLEQNTLGLGSLHIAVFHHHYSWLKVSGNENNRELFADYLKSNYDIALHGHEHERHANLNLNSENKDGIANFSGGALQSHAISGKLPTSEFQTLIIDTDARTFTKESFEFKAGRFCSKQHPSMPIPDHSIQIGGFKLKNEYLTEIDRVNLPILANDSHRKLHDFFVFPDLEKYDFSKPDLKGSYVDSSTLVEDYETVVLEGASQSGKSSLLYMLYLQFIKQLKYPLLIKGNTLNKLTKFDKACKDAFLDQYIDSSDAFDRYVQSPVETKVLLIDNIEQAQLDTKGLIELIKCAKRRFGKVIITTAPMYSLIHTLKTNEINLFVAKILSLGHVKRNELIMRFHHITDDESNGIENQVFLSRVKKSYEDVQTFLGNKVIPSYPIFILTFLQAANLGRPPKNETSYGYCYQTLLHYALAVKAGLGKEDSNVNMYFNILTHFAHKLYVKEATEINENELITFYQEYAEEYNIPPYSVVRNTLLKSGIIVESNSIYKFSYKYIYYFLVAKKISEELEESGKIEDIYKLTGQLHRVESVNILIFIAHHTKNKQLLDHLRAACQLPFEKIAPVTLDNDDDFHKLTASFIRDYKDDFLDTSVDPIKQRNELLSKKDEIERSSSMQELEDDSLEEFEANAQLQQAIKSIEILGQILKNRSGSIPKAEIENMLMELYKTAFRTIGFFGEFIRSSKEDLKTIHEQNIGDEVLGNTAILNKLSVFLEMLSLNFCLFVFSKIISSAGSKELMSNLETIAKKINTPAAEIVTFSIRTCFGIDLKRLKELIKKYEKNRLVLSIIRSRVRAYLYHNYVPDIEKQKIISALKFQAKPHDFNPKKRLR